MKKHILNSLIILSAIFFLNGCYTVLWMPQDEFPTESSYNEYYSETYYGDYYGFYDYPWWLNFAPPSVPVGGDYIRDENGTTSSLRNEGQGRGTTNDTRIITTTPPSREGSTGTNTSTTTTKSGNSNSNSGNSNNNNSNTRSSDNNSIRNNDGNRNTNSGRK